MPMFLRSLFDQYGDIMASFCNSERILLTHILVRDGVLEDTF